MQDHVLDNCLIHQKDAIIDLIDSGKHDEAITLLKFVKELWEAASYDYKYRELKERGVRAADNRENCRHWKHVQSLTAIQNKYRSL